MNAFAQAHHVPYSWLVRWCARAAAAILLAIWVWLVAVEAIRPGFRLPANIWFQAATLAMVFSGYALGWQRELLGGVLAIAGTAAFFAVNMILVGVFPPSSAAWFAAPGVLYLFAWGLGKHEHRFISQKP